MFRQAYKYALAHNSGIPTSSSGPTPVATGDPAEPSRNPLFEYIVDGILFSRWFMKTYNILLLFILGMVCVVHRLRLHLRRRRRKTGQYEDGGDHRPADRWACRPTPSRGSSSHSARTAENDETKPLISGSENRSICGRMKIMLRLRGILGYQPGSFWGYESPTISTCLVLAFYYGLNGIYGFYRVSLHPMKIFVVADRMGCVFVMNLPLLYLMSAKNPVLRALTSWSYERLNILHRAVGRVCILAATFHFAGFLWVRKTLLVSTLILRP